MINLPTISQATPASTLWFSVRRVVVGCLGSRGLAGAVGLIRRWRLIPRRRLRQRSPRRLAGEAHHLIVLLAAEEIAEHAAHIAQLRRRQRIGEIALRRLIVVGSALPLRRRARRPLAGAERILLALALVADVAAALEALSFLAACHLRILRPGRVIGDDRIALFRRRQVEARRDYQRRALLIVDRFAITLQAEAFHNAAHDLLVDGGGGTVVGGERRGGRGQHGSAEGQAAQGCTGA